MTPPPPLILPPEFSEQLDLLQGTVKIGLNLGEPLNEAPPERLTMVFGQTPMGILVRVDLDEAWTMHFVRQAPERDAREASVSVAELRGASVLDVWGSWTPMEIHITVVDRGHPSSLVTSEGSG